MSPGSSKEPVGREARHYQSIGEIKDSVHKAAAKSKVVSVEAMGVSLSAVSVEDNRG